MKSTAIPPTVCGLFFMLILLAPPAVRADDKIALTSGTFVQFATVEQAKALLGIKDDYIAGMSPFDRQLRLETDKPVSEAEILKLGPACVVPWSPADKTRMLVALMTIAPRLTDFKLPLPPTILLIETNGNEEDQNAYTRANAIILPRNFFRGDTDLNELVTHELFHVFTRFNPKLRPALYGCIGFKPCDDIELPGDLKARKISNPDEVKYDFYLTVDYQGKSLNVVPVIYSELASYSMEKGGGIFPNMVVRLLAIEKADNKWRARLVGGKPQLLEFREVSGFYDKIGRNTQYVIGPEEIMADNFMFLVSNRQNLPSPRIVEALRGVLARKSDNLPTANGN